MVVDGYLAVKWRLSGCRLSFKANISQDWKIGDARAAGHSRVDIYSMHVYRPKCNTSISNQPFLDSHVRKYGFQ